MDTNFKLIHCVDPTKIKVNIKEKFAKLTLSSNKKKKDAAGKESAGNLPGNNRFSRNLISDFSATDDIKQTVDNNAMYINPLLRSNSSSTSSDEENDVFHDSSSQGAFLAQCVETNSTEISNYIGNGVPIKTNDFVYITDRLSQQVSSLNLNCNQMSISSGEDLHEAPMQRRTSVQYESPKEKLKVVSIYISSSSGDDSKHDDDDSDDAITISDSSDCEDYKAAISEIPRTGESADHFLPSTFSNDKADRIEAFLRDVSQERKEMQLGKVCGSTGDEKNKLITVADTLSLCPDLSGSFAKQHSILDDTEPMSSTQVSAFSIPSQASTNIDRRPNKGDTSSRYLAHDETVANTIDSELAGSNLSIQIASPVHSPERTCINSDSIVADSNNDSAVPDESLTISETASEAEPDDGEQSLRKSDTNPALSAPTQPETPASTSTDSQLSQQPQILPNSINISAKINIKIQIGQLVSSDEDSKEESEVDGDESQSAEAQTERRNSLKDASSASEEQQTSTDNYCQERIALVRKDPRNDNEDHSSSSSSDNGDHATADENGTEDHNFVDHAQKILNQLYGESWRTPEVMRTLNESRSNKGHLKTGCSKNLANDLEMSSNNVPAHQAEDSVLDDFSIFRRNIKTNLDSTRRRKATPKGGKINLQTKKYPNTEKKPNAAHLRDQFNFKVPQTEVKKNTRRGANTNARWKQLIDSDNEEDYRDASEDDEPDKTDDEDASSDKETSDDSWGKDLQQHRITSSSSDSDEAIREEKKRCKRRNPNRRRKAEEKLVYLDLSKNEVEILKGNPLENKDENFEGRLKDILSVYKVVEKPKLEATPTTAKTKRKLFTAKFGDEYDEIETCGTPAENLIPPTLDNEKETVRLNGQPMPSKFELFNKQLEAVKTGTHIFKIPTPKSANIKSHSEEKDNLTPIRKQNKALNNASTTTPKDKYGFLKSLDVCVGKSLCHPDALYYRDNYKQKKEELARKLYDLYNEKLFSNKLDVSLVWNKKLLNTAGRCMNKKKMGIRLCCVELSEKVLTSPDRLRCTLIHELCHAATWIFNGEGGHGATWKSWAAKANAIFPEIPKIGVCHQYDIEYKYTYKCTLCGAKSHAHSKSKKVEFIRCSYCHGAIEIFLNKKDKEGNIMATPVREPTGFAKFVRDNYKEYKRPDLKHTDVMKLLSSEFSKLKMNEK